MAASPPRRGRPAYSGLVSIGGEFVVTACSSNPDCGVRTTRDLTASLPGYSGLASRRRGVDMGLAEPATDNLKSAGVRPLRLSLLVEDADVVRELNALDNPQARDEYAIGALRIGVLALRQVRGEFDVAGLRQEAEHLLATLNTALSNHRESLLAEIKHALTAYFDPSSGSFSERVDRLVSKEGDLEKMLHRHVGAEDSELVKTLVAHVGEHSPLLQRLSPTESDGVIRQLEVTFAGELDKQRTAILAEFSLDNQGGALSRFVQEVTARNATFSGEIGRQIDGIAAEFSLDNAGSALSRLVRHVHETESTITAQFSLDQDDSALARLQRTLLQKLSEEEKKNTEFREQVLSAVKSAEARRDEAARGTQQGRDFEEDVFLFVEREAIACGDVPERTTAAVGLIDRCKIGDCIISLGPERAAAGSRIAIESKKDRSYDLAKARREIKQARKNRGAEVGIFVFHSDCAPAPISSFDRVGDDIFCSWDPTRPECDVNLRAALTVASALCTRAHLAKEAASVDFDEFDRAILDVEQAANGLTDIETWAKTIRSNGDKILDRATEARASLLQQVGFLKVKTAEARSVLRAQQES